MWFAVWVAVAALVRLPYAHQVPMLTDEVNEVLFAARMVRDQSWPLVAQVSYIGPVFHYLIAAGLLLGAGPFWPRWLALALGALTVGLTYWLATSLSAAARAPAKAGAARPVTARDRAAGHMAAGLYAVSFIPVVVNSHIAWSNATTPFWTTLALLALGVADRRAEPRWLALAGMLLGLALQSHPSALPIAAGGALFVVLRRRAWLRTPWPWVGLALAVLFTANLLLYNAQTDGGSLAGMRERTYTVPAGEVGAEYAANARELVRMAYQLVSSSFLGRDPEQGTPELAALLRSPLAVLYGLLVLAALLLTTRRQPLPACLWLAALIMVPGINRGYRYYLQARYLAPLLPPTLAALGLWLATWTGAGPWPRRPRWRQALAGALVLLLMAYSGFRLVAFYQRELAAHRTNERLWQVLAEVRGQGTEERPITLDRSLADIDTTGGGDVLKALDSTLRAWGAARAKPRLDELPLTLPGTVMVLTPAQRQRLESALRLEPLDPGSQSAPFGPGEFGVYRVADPDGGR